MKPLGLVNQFHKLSRTFWFDLFGLINLEILNFKVMSSTDFSRKFKLGKHAVLDNVENPDGWGPPVSVTSKQNGTSPWI